MIPPIVHYMIDVAQQHWLMVRVWDCSSLKNADEPVGNGFVHYQQDARFDI